MKVARTLVPTEIRKEESRLRSGDGDIQVRSPPSGSVRHEDVERGDCGSWHATHFQGARRPPGAEVRGRTQCQVGGHMSV